MKINETNNADTKYINKIYQKDDKNKLVNKLVHVYSREFHDTVDELADAGGDIAKAFNNIRRPFRSHLLQGQMYLELAHRMYGDKAPKEIVFLYENKADQATKEFTVKADYEMVERIFFSAQKLMKAVTEGKMPECNVNSDGCKSCNSVVDLEGWGA
jgi:CRISPR/Cas system-associated exonuclease Cas4 (RecB family)